jgi:hypothetical protein
MASASNRGIYPKSKSPSVKTGFALKFIIENAVKQSLSLQPLQQSNARTSYAVTTSLLKFARHLNLFEGFNKVTNFYVVVIVNVQAALVTRGYILHVVLESF